MTGNGRGKVLGTSSKYDKGLSVLEQYELTSENTYRGRGVLICQTEEGFKMIKPYIGSEKRLIKINQVLEHLQETGHKNLDLVLKNKDGKLISEDKDGYTYIVKNWWEAKECDVRSESDLLKCMETMAWIHKDLSGIPIDEKCETEDLILQYEKHNRQLKKIREYIRHRKQKNAFEYQYLDTVEKYLHYGETAILSLYEIGYPDMRRRDMENKSICHGMCNQHNFLINGEDVILTNFDCFFIGNHMADVAQMLRKIMEKHNWNRNLAVQMLNAYDRVLHITDENWELLKIRMTYPEKYWKIANFYYNNNKAFFPENHLNKLTMFIRQEKSWITFLETVFKN